MRSYPPLLRLVAVGAVYITQALVMLASFEVVVDPRRALATAKRFLGMMLIDAWPDDAMRGLVLDDHSAVVALTHAPRLDDPTLVDALGSPTFYISAPGSRRTHARRVERLAEFGITEHLSHIWAPVGFDLGGYTPAEVAFSVVAEIIQAYHRKSTS